MISRREGLHLDRLRMRSYWLARNHGVRARVRRLSELIPSEGGAQVLVAELLVRSDCVDIERLRYRRECLSAASPIQAIPLFVACRTTTP